MSINVKAIERLLKFDKESEGEYRYVMQPILYNKLATKKVIQQAAKNSNISQGVLNAAWTAIGEVIKDWATEGHSVAIPGLGTMRFGLRADSVKDVNKVSNSLITSRRVIFTPSVDIKTELSQTGISITCYDRNGEIVKQVASADDGNVEDPSDENENEGGGSNENENQGGGSNENENENQGTGTGGNGTTGGNTGTGGNNDDPDNGME